MKAVCLLTGASGTLGGAFIHQYADRYHIIAVHYRNPIDYATQDQRYLDPLAPGLELPVNNSAVHAIRADLSDALEVDRVAREALQRFGVIDMLVNAAAIRSWSPILAPGSLAAADQMFSVNVLAPLRLSRQLARAVWQADVESNIASNRSIINVSSTAGLFVYPDTGQAIYAATKAALNHLTYHLASEFWDIGIRVNAVAPDTFPDRIPTQSVIDSIVHLADFQETGQVIPLREKPS